MNFLFDILNDMAGYTHLYYDEKDLNDDEWREMMKTMRFDHNNPYLRDDYPHILITIDDADKILYKNDILAEGWMQSLAMRLYNSTRFRRHFPVLLAASK